MLRDKVARIVGAVGRFAFSLLVIWVACDYITTTAPRFSLLVIPIIAVHLLLIGLVFWSEAQRARHASFMERALNDQSRMTARMLDVLDRNTSAMNGRRS